MKFISLFMTVIELFQNLKVVTHKEHGDLKSKNNSM